MIKEKSLVLYKQSLAIVSAMEGDKIHIQLNKGSKKVRPKDVQVLHPGPVSSLGEVQELQGNPLEAWELYQGENPAAEDLTEWVFGEFSPSAAWSLFLMLNRTPWFKGTWDCIEVSTPEERERREQSDLLKQEAEERWERFKKRLGSGKFQEEDQEFLEELRQQALGKQKKSAILKELKKEQIPSNAHRLLLKWGLEEERWNPFPQRYDVSLNSSCAELPSLPEEDRLDLTDTISYAIDDAGSKDPDDAIAWDGEYFWVHIADAAALVNPESPADLEARSRGGNLYLPEGTVHMLPKEATERLALGLQDNRSPALSFRFRLNEEGDVEEGNIFLSWIKVERISYEECEKRFHESPLKEMLQWMDIFQRKRERQGALSILMPEVKMRVDSESGEILIRPLPDLKSRQMVANAMMLTGSWVASYCLQNKIPIPYASQPTPDQQPPEGDDMATQLARRKCMQRSRISLAPGRHSGLGLDVYTRATSPLRRYSDLLVMQQLRRHLLGEAPLSEDEVTAASALYESQSASLAMAERQSNLHWKLIYLKEQENWEGEAILADQNERQGTFVIPELALETRIAMKQKKELNSKVRLAVQSVDLIENLVHFSILQDT